MFKLCRLCQYFKEHEFRAKRLIKIRNFSLSFRFLRKIFANKFINGWIPLSGFGFFKFSSMIYRYLNLSLSILLII